MISTRLEQRNNNFQKLPDYSKLLQRRDEGAVELRKKKRTENALKKRALLSTEALEVSSTVIEGSREVMNVFYSPSLLQTCPALGSFDIPPNDKTLMIFNLIKQPQSPDILKELMSLLRKILSADQNPPLAEAVKSGVSNVLIELLRTASLDIRLEAAWCITNLAYSPKETTDLLVEQGAAHALLENLDSDSLALVELCVWGLGNIASNSIEDRDLIIKLKGVKKLCRICDKNISMGLMANIAWVISCLTMLKPSPNPELFYGVLDYLPMLFQTNNEFIIEDSCKILVFLSDGSPGQIEEVVNTGLLPRITELLTYPVIDVQYSALKILGNVAAGNDSQTEYVISLGFLDKIGAMLTQKKKTEMRKEVLWTLSNILAGTLAQTKMIIGKPYFRDIVNLMKDPNLSIKKEAIWAVVNATYCKDADTILSLLQFPVLEYLVDSFEIEDIKLHSVVISAIDNILKAGEKKKENGRNIAAAKFEELGGIDIFEEILRRRGREGNPKLNKILEEFYGIGEENNEVEMMTDVPEHFMFT
ncbi:unnamed protein product [Blepharisma stoltei]|uniref:Importin subunit alpha n=1 Tax=Blepharisma stoltei TaxID=1481888 RepID=A0AAU9J1B7_9CILI|nr:unnamed protein product [Blepharisma stoltei]